MKVPYTLTIDLDVEPPANMEEKGVMQKILNRFGMLHGATLTRTMRPGRIHIKAMSVVPLEGTVRPLEEKNYDRI